MCRRDSEADRLSIIKNGLGGISKRNYSCKKYGLKYTNFSSTKEKSNYI
jgi:hypothetical protein